ncbi:MAG: hypothetical protein ISS81_00635 [Candidatus Marinimicrobia bacterium]|nr:hypothetical protein [Candidatus Neomarinimicrobiota bacterium]
MRLKKLTFLIVLFLVYFGFVGSNFAQLREPTIFPFKQKDITLVRTAGGFNFDNDDYFDIVGIASLVDSKGSKMPRTTYLVHFEESVTGDFNILWKFNIPGNVHGDFTDVVVTDIDGDGMQEIVAVINISEVISGKSPSWLYIFEYSDGFDTEPTATMSLTGSLPAWPRPIYLDKGDIDGDGRNDLVISSSGPGRGVSIVSSEGDVLTENLGFLSQLFAPEILHGILPFRAVAADIDTFPGCELLIFGGKEEFKTDVYSLNQKLEHVLSYAFTNIERGDFDISNISIGDLDGDGFSEVIIPLKSGGAQLLWREEGCLRTSCLFPDNINIETLSILDLNSNGLDEIIIHQPATSIITQFEFDVSGPISDINSYRQTVYVNPLLENVIYIDIVPVLSASSRFTGSIVIPFIHPDFYQHGLCYWQLEDIAPLADRGLVEEVLEEVDAALAVKDTLKLEIVEPPFSEMDALVSKYSGIEGEEVSLPALPTQEGVVATAFPHREVIKPDLLVHPGDKVIHPIQIPGLPLDNLKDLNVNVETPPGMKFDLAKKSFSWVPVDSQLGLHKVKASFFWEGEKAIQSFSIYVNFPPKILSSIPIRDIIQIGETFRFQLEIRDDNEDAFITYKLIEYPSGANINSAGEILWKPSFDQADWHDFIVEVSDGFDADKIEFALFVNHPMSIESSAPNLTFIGKDYRYNPVIKDKNKGFYVSRYSVSPRITDWKTTGIYEIKILDDKIRRNLSKIATRYKKSFLSGSMKIKSNPIQDAFADKGKLVLLYTLDKKRPISSSNLLSKFFKSLSLNIPKHSKPIRCYLYRYNLKEAPNGMKMYPQGKVRWVPSRSQFDFQSLSYTVSDGYFSAEEHAQIYVNCPPSIVSIPDTNAIVNGLWQYEVEVSDLNTDSRIKYKLTQAPEGMVISTKGVISWRPTNLQLNGHTFIVKVSDGMAEDIQKGRVFVNVKPRILSIPKPVALTGLKYEYLLDAEDPNGDPMVYKAVRIPKYAKFDPATGELVWQPKKSQKGVNDIVFEVVDSHGWSTIQEFQVHVFHNPGTKRISFIRSTIILLALVGVIIAVQML